MPKGRPEDYNVRGKPSSGVKASAKKKALPKQASSTARKNAFGKMGARKRR